MAMENNNTTMSTNVSDKKCRMDNTDLQLPLAIFYALVFFFGLVGNLLALWVFLKLHSKKNSIRIFLINLALADLLLVICLPFRVAYHSNNDHWVLSPVLCRIVGNVFYTNMYISITLLGLISIDRYLKFQMASCRRMFLQSRWSWILCCITWTLAFAAMVLLIAQPDDNDNESQQCFQYKKLNNSKWKAYFNIIIVGLFWVVYTSLVISYGRIGMKLLITSKEKRDFPNAAKYNKTAWKSFFVLFLFTVCFVPYHSLRIFYITSQMAPDPVCEWVRVMDKTNEVFLLMSAFNSCLDPVMYFLLCRSIRKVMLNIVCRCSCLQNIGFFSSYASHEQLNVVGPITDAKANQLINASVLDKS